MDLYVHENPEVKPHEWHSSRHTDAGWCEELALTSPAHPHTHMSSFNGHLGFHVFAAADCAAMNTGVKVAFSCVRINSFGYIPWGRIVR